jgi:hypothetical protein
MSTTPTETTIMRTLPSLSRHARPSLLALLVTVLAALFAGRAHAQSSGQMVGGPLTTSRFERLLRAYVQPTATEATALDRLHEAYLARFRAELDPEIAALGELMQGGMPTMQEFRRFMREIERLQSRIAEADAALFAACSELLAEDRRGGVARVRDARERQRALGGLTRMSAMIFGGGGAFVDLADLATRDRVLSAVPDDMRARFDAFLVAQEARLLVQARNHDKATAKALEIMFESMTTARTEVLDDTELAASGAADDADAAAAAAQDMAKRARQSMQRQLDIRRAAGEERLKIVAANFSSNRAALAELAGVLPAPVLDELRIDVATRAAGPMGLAMLRNGSLDNTQGSPAVVAARMRRDRVLGPDDVAKSREIVARWRAEYASAVEDAADAVLKGRGATSLGMPMMADPEAPEDPAAQKQRTELAKAAEAIAKSEQKALRALSELGGGRGATYLITMQHGNDNLLQAAAWKPKDAPDAFDPADPTAESLPGRLAAFASMAQGFPIPQPPSVPELIANLALVGAGRDAEDAIESVHSAWKAREYDARVTPLGEQAIALSQNLWTQGADGTMVRNDANATAYAALGIRLRDEYFAAEDALLADLAAALGLAPDGPEMTAIRLERVQSMGTDDSGFSPFDSGSCRLVTPLHAVARARVSPEAGRAFFAGSLDGWRALLAELPARMKARTDADREVERLQDAMSTSDGRGAELAQRSMQAWMRTAQLAREDVARVRTAFSAALAGVDESTAATLRSTERALAYPAFHRPADRASDLLARALLAKGATDDQLARLEALKAEYDAVFDALTDRMIAETERVAALGDQDFQRMMRQREGIEKLRFERDERTTKARSEARRILGDALASTVRGLVPDEDDALLATKPDAAFTPFASMTDDED